MSGREIEEAESDEWERDRGIEERSKSEGERITCTYLLA